MLLHDLYLLSVYFEPAEAVLYEDDLKARYGMQDFMDALRHGWLQYHRTPCLRDDNGRCYYTLSDKGLAQAGLLAAAE